MIDCIPTKSAQTLQQWPESRFGGPRIIGHRGACHHVVENTLDSFAMATMLGADMWELDVRVTADRVCVISHDDDLSAVYGVAGKISELSYAQLCQRAQLPTLAQAIALAQKSNTGLYIELKDAASGAMALAELRKHQFSYAVLGSFAVQWVAQLQQLHCEYPTSILVPIDADPFALAAAAQASIVHLCWERASDTPQHLVTPSLLAQAAQLSLQLVLWHEERPSVIKALMQLPVMGICTDRPELMVPYPGSPARNSIGSSKPQIVCHRGAEHIAPENTLAAIERVFEQGLGWAEIDIQQTADEQLIVLHDCTLQRTTNGSGNVANFTYQQISALDAGSFFNPCYKGEKIPLLSQVIALAKSFYKSLYIEIKQASVAKVLAQVKAQNFLADCFFWSFDSEKLRELRALDDTANIMVRSQDFPSVELACRSVAANVVEIEMSAADVVGDIAAVRAQGCSVMLCYQGCDVAVFESMLTLRPDLINLNRPDIWKEVFYRFNKASASQEQCST